MIVRIGIGNQGVVANTSPVNILVTDTMRYYSSNPRPPIATGSISRSGWSGESKKKKPKIVQQPIQESPVQTSRYVDPYAIHLQNQHLRSILNADS